MTAAIQDSKATIILSRLIVFSETVSQTYRPQLSQFTLTIFTNQAVTTLVAQQPLQLIRIHLLHSVSMH